MIGEPPSKPARVQESATWPSPAMRREAGRRPGGPSVGARAVDRDVEALQDGIDRVGDREPVAAGEQQADGVVGALATTSEPESPEALKGTDPSGIENWLAKCAWYPGKQMVSVSGK